MKILEDNIKYFYDFVVSKYMLRLKNYWTTLKGLPFTIRKNKNQVTEWENILTIWRSVVEHFYMMKNFYLNM